MIMEDINHLIEEALNANQLKAIPMMLKSGTKKLSPLAKAGMIGLASTAAIPVAAGIGATALNPFTYTSRIVAPSLHNIYTP